MAKCAGIVTLLLGAAMYLCLAEAQPPGDEGPRERGGTTKADSGSTSIVARMMAFDKNGDGKLTRDEISDPRLLRLFDRADVDKNGSVTKEELTALAAQMETEDRESGGRGPGGGPGGPGGFGPGGFGMGRFGRPPAPGQILPTFLQEQLKLTPKQKQQIAALQVEVDAKLAKILSNEQKKQLAEMKQGPGPGSRGGRGPGGPGRGGPPGDGPPPDDGPDGPPPRGGRPGPSDGERPPQ